VNPNDQFQKFVFKFDAWSSGALLAPQADIYYDDWDVGPEETAAYADLDQDGAADLVVSVSGAYGSPPDGYYLFRGPWNTDRVLHEADANGDIGEYPYIRRIITEDINGDGQADLLLSGIDTGFRYSYWLSPVGDDLDGTETRIAGAGSQKSPLHRTDHAAVDDYNDDGYADLLLTTETDFRILLGPIQSASTLTNADVVFTGPDDEVVLDSGLSAFVDRPGISSGAEPVLYWQDALYLFPPGQLGTIDLTAGKQIFENEYLNDGMYALYPGDLDGDDATDLAVQVIPQYRTGVDDGLDSYLLYGAGF
jgi:hypothetical protein